MPASMEGFILLQTKVKSSFYKQNDNRFSKRSLSKAKKESCCFPGFETKSFSNVITRSCYQIHPSDVVIRCRSMIRCRFRKLFALATLDAQGCVHTRAFRKKRATRRRIETRDIVFATRLRSLPCTFSSPAWRTAARSPRR